MARHTHPAKPEGFRRAMYLAIALLLTMAWYGAGSLEDVDRVAPTLFAAAAGWSIVGGIRVGSFTVWAASGVAAGSAFGWRAGQIFAIDVGWVAQEPPDSSFLAFAVYVFAALIGVPACWRHWLRPTEWRT